jgi:hypothetical protein
MVGADAWPSASGPVGPGVVHLAIPYDSRLTMTVDGTELASRPSFGTETAFDIEAAGTGVLEYERDSTRSLWLAIQAVLWIAVLAVGVGAQASFVRRRATNVYDETLIDLTGAPPLASGVAGEVLGAPTWEDDQDADDDADDAADDAVEPEAGPDEGRDRPDLEPDPDDTISFHPPAAVVAEQVATAGRSRPSFPRRATPARDTTPPVGATRPQRATAPDEVDLAALVAGVDDDATPDPVSAGDIDHEPPPASGSTEDPRR